jgi:hypothetical protein
MSNTNTVRRPRHPYYKYPVVVYRDLEPEKGTDGRLAEYRIVDLHGSEFYVPNFEEMMKFLQYHSCYGVTEPEMAKLRGVA